MKALKFVLGVQKIWCDSYTEKANQQFVEWAAKLLDKRYHRCVMRYTCYSAPHSMNCSDKDSH